MVHLISGDAFMIFLFFVPIAKHHYLAHYQNTRSGMWCAYSGENPNIPYAQNPPFLFCLGFYCPSRLFQSF